MIECRKLYTAIKSNRMKISENSFYFSSQAIYFEVT